MSSLMSGNPSTTQFMTNAVSSQAAAVAANGLEVRSDRTVFSSADFPVHFFFSVYAFIPAKPFGKYAAEHSLMGSSMVVERSSRMSERLAWEWWIGITKPVWRLRGSVTVARLALFFNHARKLIASARSSASLHRHRMRTYFLGAFFRVKPKYSCGAGIELQQASKRWSVLAAAGVKPIMLPAKSPNLNAYAERWVRSVKQECLAKLVLLGEGSLQRSLSEFTAHYHLERTHQGKGDKLLTPLAEQKGRKIHCHQRLGGLLKFNLAPHEHFGLTALDIAEYTDPEHNPMVPHTFVF